MFRRTELCDAKGYEAPAVIDYEMDCQTVICNSRESFGGFTDADSDYFDE